MAPSNHTLTYVTPPHPDIHYISISTTLPPSRTLYITPSSPTPTYLLPLPQLPSPNMHTDGGSGLGGALKPPGTSEGYLDQPPDTYSVMTDGVPRSGLGEGSVMIMDGETPAGDKCDKAELNQVDKKVWMDFEDFCKCFK